MNNTSNSLLYRVTLILLFAVLFVIALYYAKGILVPVSSAALLAMLLLPVVRGFEKRSFGKFFSVFISLILVLTIVAAVIYILSIQIISFSSDLPLIDQKLNQRFTEIQLWVENVTGVADEDQMLLLQKESSVFLDSARSIAANVLLATTGSIVFFGLLMIMTFLFLYYRQMIRSFLLQLVPEEQHIDTKKIIAEVSSVTQKYLSGVFIVMAILSVLNSLVFLIAGVPHAVFFGVLAAILNVIPYLGVWIGTLLPMLMMMITQDSIVPVIIVFAGVWFNQQIDNNFLTPRITGSQVAINPLATIIILIIGSMIWGVAGMILFIPLLGVAKIIFDNVEGLKPLGYLIGEEQTSSTSFVKKIFSRKKK